MINQKILLILTFLSYFNVTLTFISFQLNNRKSCILFSNEVNSYSISNNANDIKTKDIFSLDSIRSTLVRQEETIIFALIERAQFRINSNVYKKNSLGYSNSFLAYMLSETEKLHAQVRRYTSPEEHPFYPLNNISTILPPLDYPKLLYTEKEKVNVNNIILSWYIDELIPKLCINGDDEQYGSTVLCDITLLQALSRRIHYGKFVAESKYLSYVNEFNEYVKSNNYINIINLLTNKSVERNVIKRAYMKAATYGQDITIENNKNNYNNNGNTIASYKMNPELIIEIYRDFIIPLTKDVEIRYLYHRVGYEPPESKLYWDLCRGPLDSFE